MSTECWQMNGVCLEEAPEGYYGFVYVIVDDTGKIYIGKKAFSHQRKTKTSRKVRKETRKRVCVKKVDSKWSSYWGSCKPMLEYIKERGGTHGFRRMVLKLCKTRQSLSYWEMATLVGNKVLFREDCWNGNVLSRFFKGKIEP